MNILLVSEFFPPKVFGGGELSAYLLAKHLAQEGHRVTILTSWFSGLKREERKDGFRIVRTISTGSNPYDFWQNLKRVTVFFNSTKKALRRLCAKEQFDVIHCLNTTAVVGAAKAKKHVQIPLVATINSYPGLCPKGNLFYHEKTACTGGSLMKCAGCIPRSVYFGKFRMGPFTKYNPLFILAVYASFVWKKRAFKSVDRFISISDYITDILAHYGFTKTTKAYNVMEVPQARKKKAELAKRLKGKIVVTSASVLEKIKGIDILIKAFAKVKNKNTVLLIVGEGSEQDNLEKLSTELGIDDRVIFAGKVDYALMPFIYQQSHVIALMSLYPEPFSRVCMEAAYYGKPLIATDRGGNADGVEQGQNGFIVKPNPSMIAGKLNTLLKNRALRERMSIRAKKLYQEKFVLKKNIARIQEVYRALISQQ